MNATIIQAEDELAAVGMAIGAGWAGARSFTATSGAGISLMSEFIGFAYFTEIPVVIFDVQRVGPSTGMPTRTQQGDIQTAVYASHGDTKHIVLFPANPEECFFLSVHAFDLAERYQTPVLVLSDLDIGMNEWMTQRLVWDDSYVPDRGKVLSATELEKIENYHRYLDVDGDGIPQRTLPGVHPNGAYFLRGSGHNKFGKYTEKADEYVEVVDRLRQKVEHAQSEVTVPIIESGAGAATGDDAGVVDHRTSGRRDAVEDDPLGVITVGSSDLAVREAMECLTEEGYQFDYMRIRSFPFHEEVGGFIEAHEHCFVVEQNRDGQLRSLLILETQAKKENLTAVLSYGGMPMDAITVTEKLRNAIESRKKDELRIETESPSPKYIDK